MAFVAEQHLNYLDLTKGMLILVLFKGLNCLQLPLYSVCLALLGHNIVKIDFFIYLRRSAFSPTSFCEEFWFLFVKNKIDLWFYFFEELCQHSLNSSFVRIWKTSGFWLGNTLIILVHCIKQWQINAGKSDHLCTEQF